MKNIQKNSLSRRTRNLLLVIFFTLTLTAFFFLVAVNSLERNSRKIFGSVATIIESNTRSSDLYRKLVRLELDIRDLVNVILQEPYKLTTAKESLREQFQSIELSAEKVDSGPLQQKFLKQLRWYRSSLERLLWDYGEVNSVLYEVYFYLNSIKEQLNYMEETTGKILVDLAIKEQDTDSLQQVYVLVSSAHEKILQAHVLVDSSLAGNDLHLLVADEDNPAVDPAGTAIGKIAELENTLRTLTATDEAIARYARTIQGTIPLLQDNIFDLAVKYGRLNEHFRLFVIERDNSMKLLDDLEKQNRDRMQSIGLLVGESSRNTMLIAWLISFVVLLISVIGLVLTRNVSAKLEQTAEDALLSREAAESLNRQLEREIDEKRRFAEELEQARDELEQRVRERTAELSNANRGLALEIEERKSTEYALASEKEQLAVTLRSIGDGVITTGVDGKVVLLNKVAEELTGWALSEAAGRPLGEIFHIVCKRTGDVCENPVDIMLRTGRIYNLADETVLVARDGVERDISDSCAAIRDKDSRIIGAVLVFRDDTGKRKMQEEALKSEKLKSVGVLAGGIAHDFNNILAAILGNISLAKLQIDREKDGSAWRLLEGAEKASLRAKNLTQQLLTFSKGGEPIKKVESISEVIKDSAGFILSGGKVYCEYNFEKDLWPVNIDSGQMSQVVQNIIINAMHAMPGGGRIAITCTNITNEGGLIGALPGGHYVRISIKDQGAGIPPELLDRIFDPYFTTKEEGSGLGLALTRSIVVKHKGHIEVESGELGTDFIIYLPAMPGRGVEQKTPGAKNFVAAAKANVLVMDDEIMIRDIARDLLIHLGFNVSTVSSGQEAIDLYRERMEGGTPFDAVIMDLTIPGGMGGKEAIQHLRELDPRVRGIVSSGYSNDPVMAHYEQYGFCGMVHKPFEIEELVTTLNKVIGKEGEE